MNNTTEKSIAVLGLGKYGRSLARNLYNLGADVLAVDSDPDVVAEFTANSTSSIKANLNNEDEVLALGLKNMDIVVTAMGSNLAASIMCVSVAKEQGVPLVIAKSDSNRMASILKKVGADRIIDPEEEGGARSARILVSSYLNECFKLDENLNLLEMVPMSEWVGHSLNELDLRKTMNINVVAMRKKGGLWHFVEPDVILEEDMNLLIVMERETLKKIRGGR
ncbi:MAG: TrkA family potassium uptake protein [Lachnospiraceae bacterium]|nr:TrkA family potassium uptake protein [Lachnospiraceae bacterium]